MVDATSSPPEKKKTAWWVILLAVLGGLVVVGWMFNAATGSGEDDWNEEGAVAIDEDRFVNFAFEALEPLQFNGEFRVSSGPNLEIFVMDEVNFQSFQQGASFVHQSQCARTGLASTWSCQLPKGVWYVVIDNTNAGNESPPFDAQNNMAVVEYAFGIERL